MYQPLQHDAVACQQKMKRVANIVFYHGDEVLRRWFRRQVVIDVMFSSIIFLFIFVLQ